MKNLRLQILIVFVSLSLTLSAQELSKREARQIRQDAEAYLDEEDFDHALVNFQKLLISDPECAELHYNIGLCYFEKKQYPFALRSFQLAYNYMENAGEECVPPVELLYFHAKSLYFSDKADLALKQFELLKEELKEDHQRDFLKRIERDMELCEQYLRFIENPVDMAVTNMGSTINSVYPDYSPLISADEKTLIFTSKRPATQISRKDKKGHYYEDIFITKFINGTWESPRNISDQINTSDHDACVALSADGKELLIYKPEQNGSIYSSKLINGKWTKPKRLSKYVNTAARETHATISPDGELLYFTSDRQGGFGGLDIYVSKRTANGEWGVAQNLGTTINTKADEEGPFMHNDGSTLYFSSKGHNSIGGYDIFSTTKKNNKWSKPHNLGFPVNTSKDDVFIVISADGLKAYFSSFKEDTYGETDLYQILFKEAKKQEYIYLTGTVEACEAKELKHVQIMVKEVKTELVTGLYKPNSHTGRFFIVLSPDREYAFDFDHKGKSFHAKTMMIEETNEARIEYGSVKISTLPPCEKSRSYKAPSQGFLITRIYFTGLDYEISRNSDLDKIAHYMQQNPQAVIGLTSLTSDEGIKAEQFQIASKRVKSIKFYLKAQGVDDNRIKVKILGPTYPLTEEKANIGFNNRVEINLIEQGRSILKVKWQDPIQKGYSRTDR